MKLDKQIPSFTIFLNYKKNKWIFSRFFALSKYFEIHSYLMNIRN